MNGGGRPAPPADLSTVSSPSNLRLRRRHNGFVLERLPEGARTPAVARAITLPSAILLAGAGASAAILAGAPLAGAAVVAAACWAGRVALAIPRRKRRDINPAALREPGRSVVRQAMDAEARFQ